MRPIYPHSKKARNVNVDGWGKSVIEVDEIVNQDLFVFGSLVSRYQILSLFYKKFEQFLYEENNPVMT